MKKITLYIDDKINNYHGIFDKECFNNFKNMPEETKMELSLDGIKISSERILDKNKNNDKEFCLYNAYVNMAVISEHLIDIKIEDIK